MLSTNAETDYENTLLVYTCKCTCPIVQEQMISYYNDIDLYMLNMVNSGLILRNNSSSNTEALALDFS